VAGLFGKLPARRDFVARDLPQRFLDGFEPWLQAALAQSRETLGAAWLDHYLAAPIWRFWLSAPVFGIAAQGALMPSVDGIGRYFPLLVAAVSPPGEAIAPPGPEAEPWFARVEAALLSALDEDGRLDPVVDAVRALPSPPRGRGTPPAGPLTIWWTRGGADYPAQRVEWSGMPPPAFLAAVLTGDPRRAGTAPAGSAAP
jgi:type VI secretion system protein ImpM